MTKKQFMQQAKFRALLWAIKIPLDNAHQDALRRLQSAQAQLKQLAELLLKEDTVGADILLNMLGPRPTQTENRQGR